MQNKFLNDSRVYRGELIPLIRIAKLLTLIELAGDHHLAEAVDWCKRRFREHSEQLTANGSNRNLFGASQAAQVMLELLGGYSDDAVLNIQAAVYAVQECDRHRLVIDELQRYIEFYKIPKELPAAIPTRTKWRYWCQGAAG